MSTQDIQPQDELISGLGDGTPKLTVSATEMSILLAFLQYWEDLV